MTRILVVGATGQLGTEFTRKALESGHKVRALVRTHSRYAHLERLGAELVFADLTDAASLQRACQGVDTVVATATVVFPRGRYSFEDDEGTGYRNLLRACADASIAQLMFVSIAIPFEQRFVDNVPTVRLKLACEEAIRASGVPYTIFQATPFMDDYFALIGSGIPLHGEVAATLDRSTGVTSMLRKAFGNSIENVGVATIPGTASARHSFITVSDVATYLLRAVDHPAARNATIRIGGPEAVSWAGICAAYGGLLGRSVRAVSVSPGGLKALARVCSPLSSATANQLGLLWVLGTTRMDFDSTAAAATFGVRLTSASEYLERKFDEWRRAATVGSVELRATK